ncbi:MAG: indolepyruvate oxidoreductase subunit beta [Synergistaceae bacterium]|nr:indolepyruvate oxidoreductase subunit beta [Candidatus Equadaptatus faecalis]
MKKSIIIVGVGGQGTLLASKILSTAAMERGLFVRTSETIGMAQRGGSVSSHVRMDAKELSPVIPQGRADLLIGFELSEAARILGKLAPEAKAVVNAEKIVPTNVALKKGVYLENEYLELLKKRVPGALLIEGTPLALKAGNARSLNVVMLGAASGAGLLPFGEDEIRAALRKSVKEKTLAVNEKAFDLGLEEGLRWRG